MAYIGKHLGQTYCHCILSGEINLSSACVIAIPAVLTVDTISFTCVSSHTLSLNYHLYLMRYLKYTGHAYGPADKQEKFHESTLLIYFSFLLFPLFSAPADLAISVA